MDMTNFGTPSLANVRYIDETQTSIRADIGETTYSIPVNLDNRHYQMVLAWLENPENTIAPYDGPRLDEMMNLD